ncbi:MAG: cell division protein ZapA [Lachnospiraceae bacterium]|nr:cell division protein ZapA [Lachnospiraceae bacterium]
MKEDIMFEKSNTQVVIQGKILTMAGYEKEEYLQSIASYLNKKDQELKEQTKGKRITSDLYSIYLQINIADELMKAREQIAQLEDDVKKKDEELTLSRQQIAALTVQNEELKKKPEGENA